MAKKKKVLEIVLWVLLVLAILILAGVIIFYSYLHFFVVPKLNMDQDEIKQITDSISVSDIAKIFTDKQISDNIKNFDKESAQEVLKVLNELNEEINGVKPDNGKTSSGKNSETSKNSNNPQENKAGNDKTSNGNGNSVSSNKGDKQVNSGNNGKGSSSSSGNNAGNNNKQAKNDSNKNGASPSGNNAQNSPENGKGTSISNTDITATENSGEPATEDSGQDNNGLDKYKDILEAADESEIEQALSIMSKIDISLITELRNNGKNDEVKEYLRNNLTPEEISQAINLYNKYGKYLKN